MIENSKKLLREIGKIRIIVIRKWKYITITCMEAKKMAQKKKRNQATAGIFQIYSELDKEKKHTYTGASKRIPICVRDYKQFLLKGTASKKLTQMVETISQETGKAFEEVVDSLTYEVIKEATPEKVQEEKDKMKSQQQKEGGKSATK